MVGEVHRRGGVGDRFVIQAQLIARRQRVGDGHGKIAGKTLIAVGAEKPQAQRRVVGGHHLQNAGAPALAAPAMQGDAEFVLHQRIMFSIQREAAPDAVGITPDQAIPPAAGFIGARILQPQHHVGALRIRMDGGDGAAHVQHGGGHAPRIGKREGVDGRATLLVAVKYAVHGHVPLKQPR